MRMWNVVNARGSRLAVLVLLGAVALGARGTAPSAAEMGELVPTKAKPVKVSPEQKEELASWQKAVDAFMSVPALEVRAAAAASDFPGAVPAGVEAVTREVAVAMNVPRWHSTGLYAAPGARVTVRVSEADARRGLSIVIGAHTDSLMKVGSWPRFPKISRRFTITATETTVANAFGGLIYVDVPRDARLDGFHVSTYGGYGWIGETPDAVTDVAHVKIEGAVASPLYVLGQTTAEQWRAQLAKTKAPWGELQSDRIILTVETAHLADVADPAALLKFWGTVVDAEATLAGWGKSPVSPERIVLDREISAGFMHSGYPIMAHLSSERDLLKLSDLQAKGSWGYFHELGHNHEAQACTFGADYVEVNVNLFSLYVMQRIVGNKDRGHPALRDLPKLIEARLGPAKKDGPFENLTLYIVTIDAFGWEPVQKALGSYATPHGADGIKTRQQKIDAWVDRYSNAVGKNLAPLYELYDLKVSAEVAAGLKGLPVWMPAELVKYQR